MSWDVITGHTLDVLAGLDAKSVQTVVTSPPYWGLRDYGDEGQVWPEVVFSPIPGFTHMSIPAQTVALGLESEVWAYVGHMVAVFREVRRVLRDDGTLWLNLGDSYAVTKQNRSNEFIEKTGGNTGLNTRNGRTHEQSGIPPFLKAKDLYGIPWRVAFALQADGWYLRSDIIWHKPNPMPEPVTDRPTKAHEYLFLLTKHRRYFYDHDAIKEPSIHAGKVENRRNVRSVWTMSTRPSPDAAHFAVFPPDLPERCIKAGTSEHGCCKSCGAPWLRKVERTAMEIQPTPKRKKWQDENDPRSRTQTGGTVTKPATAKMLGWDPGCSCGSDRTPCLVLDPFSGAGTTGMAATRQRRRYIGIEQSEQYAEQSRLSIEGDAPLFNRVLD